MIAQTSGSASAAEVEAIRVAMYGTAWQRARLAWRSGFGLARDPNDTQKVLLLAIAVDRITLLRNWARLVDDPTGAELIRSRAAIDSKHVDFAMLRSLPPDTMGGAYIRALDARGLNPDFFQRPPGLPEELAYVAQRARQTHDVWHVLAGLDTDIPGEIALQAFTAAQLNQNFSKLIVRFGLLFFGARYPQIWGMVRRARRAGREAKFLLAVRWEDLWAEPLAEVRVRLGIEPAGFGGS
jgi:ubiquinone biosynthesis protein COQ4